MMGRIGKTLATNLPALAPGGVDFHLDGDVLVGENNMTKRMLVDATHPEETRVAIVDGNWLSDFDFERTSKKQLKGNIYLAKVIRIEPSLQAAFVEYGGNRHGFLPFSEIHPDYFRIPMADRPQDEMLDDASDDSDSVNESDESEDNAEMAAIELRAHADDADTVGNDDESGALPLAHIPAMHVDVLSDIHSSDVLASDAPASSPLAGSDFLHHHTHDHDHTHDAAHDLGLITDFGNAAIDMPTGDTPIDLMAPAEEPVPLETVGGEPAEEERFRRPPRPRYKIQEVVKRRQVMLIQVVKEERGNKGAALTTFLSLAGRYCVLMPNTDHGGGVSRKITSHQDRRRMKEMLDQLEIPEGMAVILLTAGMEQEPAEIQRDLEYLLRLWNSIREQTLQSTAPALIYEEANLIKRSMRDLYSHDVSEILVAGQRGHQLAIDFMRTIMPDQLDKVRLYEDSVPLFFRYNVEKQIDALYSPTVQLRSGGYIVINPTEALVSIDVNSGRATRERHIEGTALKTNLEAAEEIARQLRLRDLAGLVVIDFIDMEDGRNNAAVERRVKESMRSDRARLQIGRISPFGLLELSRQRLHSSLMEINFEKCTHCAGIGLVRSIDSSAISILRMIEEEGIRQGAAELVLHVPTKVALYILNQKRMALSEIEHRYNLQVLLHSDDALVSPDFRLERVRGNQDRGPVAAVNMENIMVDPRPPSPPASHFENDDGSSSEAGSDQGSTQPQGQGRRRGRNGFGRNRNRNQGQGQHQPNQLQQAQQPHPSAHEARGNIVEADPVEGDDNIGNTDHGHSDDPAAPGDAADQQRRGRRRGRRGGRGRRPNGTGAPNGEQNQRPWTRNNDNHQKDNVTVPHAASTIPASIHDIDTTPRDTHHTPSSYRSGASNPQPRTATSSAPTAYEFVDQPPEKPKGGWWRRLTGQ